MAHAPGIICQSCGVEAPTKYVEFHQNIGALFMRFYRSIKGNLCKRCIHRHFWKMTMITLLIGWLGMISIIVAPFMVLNNIFRYIFALGMPSVPAGATAPVVNEEAMNKFLARANEVYDRVGKGEDLTTVAIAVAPQIGITPGQLIKCAIAVAQQQRAQTAAQKPTGGFPVVQTVAQSLQPMTPIPLPPPVMPPQPQAEAPLAPPPPPPPQIGLGA